MCPQSSLWPVVLATAALLQEPGKILLEGNTLVSQTQQSHWHLSL